MKVPEAMALIIKLAEKDGISEINKLSGCWEREIANGWKFSVNGHAEVISNIEGVNVPPFSAAFSKGGLLVGFVDPRGGTVIQGAEDEIIAALKLTLNETPTV